MFKSVVKYEDFNGNHKEEALYFNMNKPEMIRLLKTRPTITDELQDMANKLAMDNPPDGLFVDFMTFIEDLIGYSYGKKTDDGRFIKNNNVLEDLRTSNAYEAFYTKLLNDPKEFNTFVEQIFPADVMTEALKEQAKEQAEGMIKPETAE